MLRCLCFFKLTLQWEAGKREQLAVAQGSTHSQPGCMVQTPVCMAPAPPRLQDRETYSGQTDEGPQEVTLRDCYSACES